MYYNLYITSRLYLNEKGWRIVARKDTKGRNLRTGESQRTDGRYVYRYTDLTGKRRDIYNQDLIKLRSEEKRVKRDLEDGIYTNDLTVKELVEMYIEQKRNVRYNTQVGYKFVMNLVGQFDFAYMNISNVKTADAKKLLLDIQQSGRGYSSICSVRGVLKPAFRMAVNEDMVRKNPFDFPLDMIENDTKSRNALTDSQIEKYFAFIKGDKHFSRYYDEIMVLLETGLRISEFVGLTLKDIDMEQRKISVTHQLTRKRDGTYYIEATKTSNGTRDIPMTNAAWNAFDSIIKARKSPRIEIMVDGYSGFLLLDKDEKPKVALHIEKVMQRIKEKCNSIQEEKLPDITPHVLRHTYCTRLVRMGVNPKTVQYLMGHSDVTITLNIYTHEDCDNAREELKKNNML